MSASPAPTHTSQTEKSPAGGSRTSCATPSSSCPPAPLLTSFTLEGLAEYMKLQKPSRILVMMGAGVSVAAGIPDFRSPGVGLYSKLAEKYPELAQQPEKLFDLDSFRANPSLFYKVMNEMNLWPDAYHATKAHRFVRLLQDKGILLRCYTQNIDTLERVAGVKDELLVEAHGAFASAHCLECRRAVDMKYVEGCAKSGNVPRCSGEKETRNGEAGARGDKDALACNGLIKPDVVFFGESLPERFFELARDDTDACDLLLILGTSLKVYPFAMMPSFVSRNIPRVLINMTRAGDRTFVFQTDADGTADSVAPPDDSSDSDRSDCGSSSSSEGPNATPLPAGQLLHCYRDLLLAGDCQATVEKLVNTLGWELPPDE